MKSKALYLIPLLLTLFVACKNSSKQITVNNHEFNRFRMNVHISERALREIYLNNFQIALQQCEPWTIMSSYNMINGTYTSQNRALLNTFLRQETHFKGLVMTDWFAGKEVVQLYLAAPKSKLDKPESELKAFGKTKLLQPNESQALTFTLSATDLASFDPNLSAWVADGGVYTVKIGRSALDIEGQATFTLPETKVLGKTPRILLPQKTVVELKRGNR